MRILLDASVGVIRSLSKERGLGLALAAKTCPPVGRTFGF
jgi:hypothetical protein